MARLVPSPDWFVGVDSLELCKNGQWVDKLTKDLPPYDAGTDRGFTFTAPNWPEIPYKEIYQITSKLPNHPANSFFYPELDKLPTLATLTVVRVETIAKDKASSFSKKNKDKDTLNDDYRPKKTYNTKEPEIFNDEQNIENHVARKPEFSMFRTDMRPKTYTPAPVVTTQPPPTRASRPQRKLARTTGK